MRFSNNWPRRYRKYAIFLPSAICAVVFRDLRAQEKVQHAPGYDPNATAHVHNQDMSCCAPCAPETNQNADVFKRPCFVRALQRSLEKPKKASYGLTGPIESKVPQNGLPLQSIRASESLLGTFLQPDYLPEAWDEVSFYVPYPVKAVMQLRGGAPTLVGHEVNHSPEANDAKYDAIQSAWTVGPIDVLPRIPFELGKAPRGALIRLRLYGEERLELHPRPREFHQPGERRGFFDQRAFHGLLTKAFRVPFRSTDDWFSDGYDATYEGVRVFHGHIVARERGRVWVGGDNPPQHWWEQMRLLVTDSDPQYFCVEIALRPEDAVEGEGP
jgi:hypothetical protein